MAVYVEVVDKVGHWVATCMYICIEVTITIATELM